MQKYYRAFLFYSSKKSDWDENLQQRKKNDGNMKKEF